MLRKWKLIKYIKAGGNGEVWEATSSDFTSPAAIKILKRINYEGYIRFRDEVKVLKEHGDIQGLLPIIDYYLPENPNKDAPWYVMPFADPITKYLKGKTPEQIVDAIISVSEILIKLHKRGISHRDIKPPNILVRDDIIFLSDFGLAEYPDKQDITLQWKDVGPRWTIAPEMRRNPDTADGKLADVYSIAKTLWILLTGVKQGFDGQYSSSNIEIKKYVSSIYHMPLDELLFRCTDNDPKARKSIIDFNNDLTKWKGLNKDFERRTKSEWKDIQNELFPSSMPKTVIWDDINDIVKILNFVGEHSQVNHTFLPGGGGLDLTGAIISYETGCIELHFQGFPYIVKPKQLTFESFSGHIDWSYFRLDTEGLGLIGDNSGNMTDEGLTEIKRGLYSDSDCFKFNDYNGRPLPKSARPVIRVSEGSFLVCLKTGPYNSIPQTYDGRHNKVNGDEFRKIINQYINQTQKEKIDDTEASKIKSNKGKPRFVKPKKFRKGSKKLNQYDIKVLKKIINLYSDMQIENQELKKQAGLDDDILDYFAENTIDARMKFRNLPKSKKEIFEKYLKSLSNDDLALVEAVMYGGREALTSGRAYPLDEMLDQFKSDSRSSRIHSITEKASLEEYLTAGLNSYK